MDDVVPKLGEILLELPPVFRHFLDPEGSPYQTWFPVDEMGEAVGELSRRAFREAANRDELASLMPLMAYVDKRVGTDPHPAVNNPGAAYLFGGRDRDFDMNARIRRPLWVGERVRVRLSARLFGPALIGDRAFLSTGSIVMRSVIGPRTEVDDGAKIKDSLVGANAYIGQDVKLLSKQASLKAKPPRPKMGCVVGDGCRVGANCVLMPGTILMPNVIVPECTKLMAKIYDQAGIDRLSRR